MTLLNKKSAYKFEVLLLFILFLIYSCNEQTIKLPEGQEISKESAINDIHNNSKMYWLEYGEPNNHKCKNEIRKKYGLQIYQITGCEITESLVSKINEYNNVIDGYMTEVYDTKWKEKLLGSEIDCSEIKLKNE